MRVFILEPASEETWPLPKWVSHIFLLSLSWQVLIYIPFSPSCCIFTEFSLLYGMYSKQPSGSALWGQRRPDCSSPPSNHSCFLHESLLIFLWGNAHSLLFVHIPHGACVLIQYNNRLREDLVCPSQTRESRDVCMNRKDKGTCSPRGLLNR